MRHIDSSLGGILMSLNPLATLLLAHIFVAGEKLTRWTVSGFGLGFLGMIILFGPDAWAAMTQKETALIYQLAVAGSALLYAVNNVLARNVPPTSPIVVAACVLPLAAIIVTPIALIMDGSPTSLSPPPPGTIAALLFLSIFTTALATVVYMALVKSAGPTFLSLANYLVPLFAIAVGFIFANEIPSWNALIALVVLLSGIAISQRRRPVIEQSNRPADRSFETDD
jgi:drug/metabolite transporter (DMT)-like permease